MSMDRSTEDKIVAIENVSTGESSEFLEKLRMKIEGAQTKLAVCIGILKKCDNSISLAIQAGNKLKNELTDIKHFFEALRTSYKDTSTKFHTSKVEIEQLMRTRGLLKQHLEEQDVALHMQYERRLKLIDDFKETLAARNKTYSEDKEKYEEQILPLRTVVEKNNNQIIVLEQNLKKYEEARNFSKDF